MSAELDARRAAACAVAADFGRWNLGETVSGDWQMWALRLARCLQLVLDQIDADIAAEPGHQCQAGAILQQIRDVLEVFDWQTDDTAYCLEQIEDIALRSPR